MATTLLDLELDLLKASDAVMALNDRLEAGEAVSETEYDAALVPFNENLSLSKAKRDRFAEFVLFLGKQAELHSERAAMDSKRAKAITNLAGRLKDLAIFAIRMTDSVKLEGEVRTMQIYQNSQEALTVKDESGIPESCYDMVTTRVLNKVALKAAIKAGTVPATVATLERGEHLRIR